MDFLSRWARHIAGMNGRVFDGILPKITGVRRYWSRTGEWSAVYLAYKRVSRVAGGETAARWYLPARLASQFAGTPPRRQVFDSTLQPHRSWFAPNRELRSAVEAEDHDIVWMVQTRTITPGAFRSGMFSTTPYPSRVRISIHRCPSRAMRASHHVTFWLWLH